MVLLNNFIDRLNTSKKIFLFFSLLIIQVLFIALIIIFLFNLEFIDILKDNVSQNIKNIYFSLVYLSLIFNLNLLSEKPFQRLLKNPVKIKMLFQGFIVGFASIVFYYLALTYQSYFLFTAINVDYLLFGQILVLSFIIALTEELIFRDFLLRELLKKYSENKSLIISSYIYAQLHFLRFNLEIWQFIIPLISLFFIGLILSDGYLKKNIFYSIGIHWAWILIISYLNQTNILKINNISYLTGGYYPPSGLFACIILFITVVVLFSKKYQLAKVKR